MYRFYSLEDLLSRKDRPPTCLAIGVFDGVHRGHVHLLEQARVIARKSGETGPPLRLGVLTFQNHPLTLLRPTEAPAMLSSVARRLDWIETLGFDIAAALHFNEYVSHLEPRRFLEEIVVGAFAARCIVCGPDFRFGYRGNGTVEYVQSLESVLRLRVEKVEALLHEDEPISSSRIRRLVREGYVREAETLLGRPYEIEGTVIPGHQRGRKLGFPTANLETPGKIVLPRTGVYAVSVETPEAIFPAMMNVGYSPTFGDIEEVRLEVHLLDFEGNLLGRRLRVSVLEFLREEIHFPSADALVRQLHQDKARSRSLIARLTRDGRSSS